MFTSHAVRNTCGVSSVPTSEKQAERLSQEHNRRARDSKQALQPHTRRCVPVFANHHTRWKKLRYKTDGLRYYTRICLQYFFVTSAGENYEFSQRTHPHIDNKTHTHATRETSVEE